MQTPEPASEPATAETSSRCISPLDKPLPSLPIATVDTKSPLKVRRSLIDATEKPLRKSLSPHVVEEWPALSPQKLTPASAPIEHSKDVKVSLGESIIERVKKLNISDEKSSKRITSEMKEQASDTNTDEDDGTAKSGRKPVQLRDSVDAQSPVAKIARGIPIAVNSNLPGPRYIQVSDMRKRLSSTPLTSPRQIKSKTNDTQAASDPEHFIVGRGRLVDHPGPGRRPGPIRIRSQSRHRVTEEGSPYVIPQRLRSSRKSSRKIHDIREDDPVAANNLEAAASAQGLPFSQSNVAKAESLTTHDAHVTENVEIDAIATVPQAGAHVKQSYNASPLSMLYGDSHSPKGIAIKKTRSTSGASRSSPKNRLSSVPLPSHLVKSKTVCVGSSSTSSPFKSRNKFIAVTEHDVHGEVKETGIDQKHDENAILTKRGSMSSNADPAERMSIIPTAAIVEEYLRMNQDESKDSTNGKSNATITHEQDEFDSYKIKSLNRSAPKYGARLKVSDSAHDLLLGDDNEAVKDSVTSKNSSLTNVLHLSSSRDRLRRSGQAMKDNLIAVRDFAERSFSTSPDKNASNIVDTKFGEVEQAVEVPKDDLAGQRPVKAVSSRLSSLPAPPIKSGPVRDISSSSAWPLRESAITPFEQVAPTSLRSPSFSPDLSIKHKSSSVQETASKAVKFHDPPHAGKSPSYGQISSEASSRVPSRNIARKPVPLRVASTGPSESGTPELSSMSRPKTPVTKPAQPKFMKPFSRNTAQSRTDSKGKKSTTVSPDAVPGAVSTGKGKAVMSNIRGLFHKRSTEQANGYKKLHQSLEAHKAAVQSGSSPDMFSESPSRMPSSPKVKNIPQTIHQRRQARQESETFKRGHRDIATVTPRTLKSPGTPDTQEAARRYILEPFPDLDLSSPGPSLDTKMPETPLEAATKLAHDLLDRANNELNATRKTELVEVCHLLFPIIFPLHSSPSCFFIFLHSSLLLSISPFEFSIYPLEQTYELEIKY